MKKALFIGVVAMFAMTSCKKDYTCTCTSSSTVPGSTSTTSKATIKGVSKKTAKDACVSTSSEFTAGGTTYVSTNDCSI